MCVNGCRWPFNERKQRMDTFNGLNGASPLFMRWCTRFLTKDGQGLVSL